MPPCRPAAPQSPTDGDKYQDNHYAADLQISGDYLVTYMYGHTPYPLSQHSWWGYACAQDYLIDPTGWTIQTDLQFTYSYPGCTEAATEGLWARPRRGRSSRRRRASKASQGRGDGASSRHTRAEQALCPRSGSVTTDTSLHSRARDRPACVRRVQRRAHTLLSPVSTARSER